MLKRLPVAPNKPIANCDRFRIQLEAAKCDLKLPIHIGPQARRYIFLPCTLAATFNRSAFSRMKPVASSWL